LEDDLRRACGGLAAAGSLKLVCGSNSGIFDFGILL
jgi:hypothetical protein